MGTYDPASYGANYDIGVQVKKLPPRFSIPFTLSPELKPKVKEPKIVEQAFEVPVKFAIVKHGLIKQSSAHKVVKHSFFKVQDERKVIDPVFKMSDLKKGSIVSHSFEITANKHDELAEIAEVYEVYEMAKREGLI
jgi:hypothetical protein